MLHLKGQTGSFGAAWLHFTFFVTRLELMGVAQKNNSLLLVKNGEILRCKNPSAVTHEGPHAADTLSGNQVT